MKKYLLLVLFSTVLISSFELMAQTGNPWLIGGNNLTANRAIGSNNNFGLSFKTNNTQRGLITNNGNWGIGIGINNNNIGSYAFKLRHATFGLNIESTINGHDWELVTDLSGVLSLYFNNNFKGSFSYIDGTYSAVSDERLKKNIQEMPSVLEKINQLKPSTYQFKNSSTEIYNGFMAQDVIKVFPSLVTHTINNERDLDVYTLNYGGIGVIAIKGIQELHQTIQGQQKTITSLEDRITKLEAALNSVSSNLSSKDLGKVSLHQNQPNPFSQTTVINYHLPQRASSAVVNFTDMNGKLLKTVTLTEQGKGQLILEAGQFAAGTYQYSLIVNGKLMDTKKMVLMK